MISFSNSVLTHFKHISTKAQQKIYLPFGKNTATEKICVSLNITSQKKSEKRFLVLQTVLLMVSK